MEKFCHMDLSFFNNSSLPQILSTLSPGILPRHRLGVQAGALLGDYTFRRRQKSGRVLNICVTAANTNEPQSCQLPHGAQRGDSTPWRPPRLSHSLHADAPAREEQEGKSS